MRLPPYRGMTDSELAAFVALLPMLIVVDVAGAGLTAAWGWLRPRVGLPLVVAIVEAEAYVAMRFVAFVLGGLSA